MDIQQQQQQQQQQQKMTSEKVGEQEEVLLDQAAKQQSAAVPPRTASPPSSSSSPSHEFSFTISLHSNPSTAIPDKTKSPPSFAIDLSPADDIFFHGHLLPLHLLSHLPVSPRSSTNSLDSFTLPIRELLQDQKQSIKQNNETEGRRSKSTKLFSFLRLTRWPRKGCETREKEGKSEKNNTKKQRFDVLKRYVRMVRPLLFFIRGRREKNVQLRRQPYSFSGNLLGSKVKQELRGRKGEFSAPASMRTSPTNSGLLLATSATLPSYKSDSTMEELQAAIQAAIAHCKNSIAEEDKPN